MRKRVLAGVAVGFCAIFGGAGTVAAADLRTGIDLDYAYTQTNVGGDVDAETQFNQKYQLDYTTSLTTSYDFVGAVRLELQDTWSTSVPGTSLVAPTLELQAKGSQAAAKLAYEMKVNTTEPAFDAAGFTTYSTNLSLDLEMTVPLWPDVKLKMQRKRDSQESSKDSTTNTFEFSARKDFYGLRVEYTIGREVIETSMPSQATSAETNWSAKAAYKEILWGGTEFELAYEIKETYGDEHDRGIFSGETSTYDQQLKTRVKNTLDIAPRLRLGLAWEYQYDQDLLALDFDYKLKNIYTLDLRWDAFDWLQITSEAKRETNLEAGVEGEEDARTLVDTLKVGFDYTTIPWMRISGKAELKDEGKVAAGTGGSVDQLEEEKYELIAKNVFGEFWDFTWNASATNQFVNDVHISRETRMKGDLKLKLLDLVVASAYEVSRLNEGALDFGFLFHQQQVRDAKIKFEYQVQLADMIKAAFAHEYGMKVDDSLDEVLNFERILQFNEDTRFTFIMDEVIRNLRVEGEVDRKASDTEGDPDPQLVELSYALKLEWQYEALSVLSSFKYNDKGDAFDDLSFNAKASWKYDQLEVTGEYQFDKIIKEITDPKDEKRKLSLKLSYKF